MADPQRVIFLFSDTGGGHRSAAEAVVEALERNYGGRYDCLLVDFFKEYAPFPLRHSPELYPKIMRLPRLWGAGYHLCDHPRRVSMLLRLLWPYLRSSVQRLISEMEADLLVAVHPLINRPYFAARNADGPPFITVVTDLVNPHAFWFDPGMDLCLVPTAEAGRRAQACGIDSDRVKVVGLPVARSFGPPREGLQRVRIELGWPEDRPVVLLIGGGEGMGLLYETARGIARGGGHLALAVVAGRNRRLRERLEKVAWEVPTFVYGFERRIASMMQAASLLVTKAGPGTIVEALNSGLPLVLYDFLPGQEECNVDYVVERGAGVWAPSPDKAARAVRRFLTDDEALREASAACRRVSKPQAAQRVATLIHARLSNEEGDRLGAV